MHEVALFSSGVTAVTVTTTVVEFGLVAVALVLFIALLALRAVRARNQKLRRAASSGYYDPDVARYGYGTPAVPSEPPIDLDGIPLAPTFVAPGQGRATKQRVSAAPASRPSPASFGSMSLAPPRPVPIFDQASVIKARPVSDTTRPVSSGPPTPPPPPPPGGSSLPPLVQPPPPAGKPKDG